MSVINVKKHTTGEVETPQINRTSIYIKTDNSLAWKDDTGTEHVAATGISPEEVQDIIGATMADSSTIDFTYNDAGNQIDHMGESLIARYKQRCGDASAEVPEDGYHGQDIVNIAEKLYQEIGDKYFANPEEHIDFLRNMELKLCWIK